MISFQAPDAHRVVAVGGTRSGKSELLRYLFCRGISDGAQGVIVDPKGDWRVLDTARHVLHAERLEPARAEVELIDWAAPLVHVQPVHGNRAQLTALYDRIARLRGDVVVWSDEGYAISTASWAPNGLLKLQTAGAARGQAHLVATQRPVNVKRELLTEADHLFLFRRLHRDDIATAVQAFAGVVDASPADVEEELRDLPEWGFLWADRRAGELIRSQPLPDGLRRYGPVEKLAAAERPAAAAAIRRRPPSPQAQALEELEEA
jgi:hypothetical protein